LSVVAVLILFSLLVAGGFLFAFMWAVKSGQYDDKYTPSVRMLFDDKNQVFSINKKTNTIKSRTNVEKHNAN